MIDYIYINFDYTHKATIYQKDRKLWHDHQYNAQENMIKETWQLFSIVAKSKNNVCKLSRSININDAGLTKGLFFMREASAVESHIQQHNRIYFEIYLGLRYIQL